MDKLTKHNLKLVNTISTSNMVLFVKDDKLKKFKNVEEILNYFIDERFNLYKTRKTHIIINLETKLKDLKVEMRFVKEVVDDDIIIFKRSEEDIISDLKKGKYEEKDGGYDYLLKIHISKFTKTQITKLDNEIKRIENELESVRNTSEKDMWIKELRELEESL